MADIPPISTSDLKEVLEQIAIPGRLVNHSLLGSWLVAEYLQDHPDMAQVSPEFLIGQALEWQLELWSKEYPLAEAYHDDWLKIFCLKWFYFQKKPRLAAYQKHPTLAKLGEALIDAEVLAKLVPGKEAAAEELLEAEEYRAFWYSFGDTERTLAPNRASEKLKAALEAFAEQIETRRAHKFASPARLPQLEQSVANAHGIQQSVVVTTQPAAQTNVTPVELVEYQQILNRQHPVIVGYKPPACRVDVAGSSASIPGEVAARRFVEQYHTVIIQGEAGIGKTAFLAQLVIHAARQINLIPVWVSLPEYFSREASSDFPGFVSDHVFARWYPENRETFRSELSQAERKRQVVWLLDGYDELSPTQRTTVNREIALLDRFVLTTRTSQPALNHPLNAQVQLLPIDRDDALAFIEALHPTTRGSISDWMDHNADVQRALTNSLILRQAAEVVQDSPQGLQLTAVLNRAITEQMMTHVHLRSTVDSDVISRARIALGHLAWQVLSPQRELDRDRNQVSDHELRAAWNVQNNPPEDLFYDILRATGLLSKDANGWNFWSDLIRDELAAECAVTEKLIHTELAYYPQYTRVIAFWVAKLMSSQQPQPAIELLRNLLVDSEEDPYGARLMTVVAALKECRFIKHIELASIRHQVEQPLVAMYDGTASNRLKAWIADSLIALQSLTTVSIPNPESREEIWRDLNTANPQHDLATVLLTSGYNDLVKVASGSPAYDNDITHALIDALQSGDVNTAISAAVYLQGRDLTNATVLEIEQGRRPIQRLVNLALMPSAGQQTMTDMWRRMKLIQSLALAVLSQPEILCNPGVLRWVPASVVHMLMVALNLRIRLKDNRPILITADGREQILPDDAYV
ncbi:MAG: NACHT domain-containing protein, partial [Anaerolineae bacterium]